MIPKAKLLLKLPIAASVSAAVVVFGVALWAWFAVLRPRILMDESPMPAGNVAPAAETAPKAQDVAPSYEVTLMILSWSNDLAADLESYAREISLDGQTRVNVVYKNESAVVVPLHRLRTTIDSIWKVDAIEESVPVSASSLPTVLQSGFQRAKHATAKKQVVILLGDFPNLGTDESIRQRYKNRPILATDDVNWIPSSNVTHVAMISRRSRDGVRSGLLEAMMEDSVVVDKRFPR